MTGFPTLPPPPGLERFPAIRFPRLPDWPPDARVHIEIDGQPLHDPVDPFRVSRTRRGFGQRRFGDGPFGLGPGPGFGFGALGVHAFGRGGQLHRHVGDHPRPAADLNVRLAATIDPAAMITFTADATHAHRPRPDPPRNVDLTQDGQHDAALACS